MRPLSPASRPSVGRVPSFVLHALARPSRPLLNILAGNFLRLGHGAHASRLEPTVAGLGGCSMALCEGFGTAPRIAL